MSFIDSHCHINFHELAENIDDVLAKMQQNEVLAALCVSVNLRDFPSVLALASEYQNIYASVGVHPDYEDVEEPTVARLVELAQHPKIIAIGETGLDYYRLTGDLEWQRERFRNHIRAARLSGKPLIIHTRSAAEDTLRLMAEEGAGSIGGVMHCFTENWEVAQAALDMGFYISFSGIVTFKNALQIKEVAQRVPLERILIETDSPYLAPVPFRGKLNQPAYVKHVAEEIALLRGVGVAEVGRQTSENFARLFKL
ncbi:TatD family hydrolase [Gallionella capsiferriformans]|jgi:TatD DNase family protein|uniref:Hydrolase, TatD family n=1 Tax=Gallionella capsiferriformans (strain ES-2) TaxID=395494 RepID=D9SDU3_GALCS|nr:TatD family hydrolase [Gallionella capsiferriformans]ADL54850.1 hydrolase, TatD family [Gallionella capsiferriformans ES-2]